MARCSHNVLIASPQTPGSLEEALETLKVTLEDYQGQFPELQRLEEAVMALESWLKVSHLFIYFIIIIFLGGTVNIGCD